MFCARGCVKLHKGDTRSYVNVSSLGHHFDCSLVDGEVAGLDDGVEHAHHDLRRQHRRHRSRAALRRTLDLWDAIRIKLH